MRVLSVLLVEDDSKACAKFLAIADRMDDLSIVGTTGDSEEAIQKIKDHLPDAVILDLELHHGGGTGLDVLRAVQSGGLERKPYMLITTNNSSPTTYEFARQLGADYIMYKHQNRYSEQAVMDMLLMMKDAICNREASQEEDIPTPHQKQQRLKKRIIAELNLVGISPKAKGFQYLTEGILLTIKEPQQHLCESIAAKYEKSSASVERAIQNAIDKAWRTTDVDDLLKYYTAKISSDKGIPTITEFVYYYANKLRDEYA